MQDQTLVSHFATVLAALSAAGPPLGDRFSGGDGPHDWDARKEPRYYGRTLAGSSSAWKVALSWSVLGLLSVTGRHKAWDVLW